MDRCFYIEVKTYSSTNNMGRELGQYVNEEYDHTVIHQDKMCDIAADIKNKMEELQKKYPKCKAFEFEHNGYSDRYGVTCDRITVKPSNKYNDNYVFVLEASFVRKLIC